MKYLYSELRETDKTDKYESPNLVLTILMLKIKTEKLTFVKKKKDYFPFTVLKICNLVWQIA